MIATRYLSGVQLELVLLLLNSCSDLLRMLHDLHTNLTTHDCITVYSYCNVRKCMNVLRLFFYLLVEQPFGLEILESISDYGLRRCVCQPEKFSAFLSFANVCDLTTWLDSISRQYTRFVKIEPDTTCKFACKL